MAYQNERMRTTPSPATPDAEPSYQRIKSHVLAQIQQGHWREGDAIPAENALAAEFGVSRMTANRALRELTDEQVLMRVQGSGTFVAQQKFQSTLVMIQGIAQEIQARRHQHRCELHRLERVRATTRIAAQFELSGARTLFHSVVVHFENGLPIQVEDRYVNPPLAPEYMQLDFTTTTVNEYLMRVAPLSGVRYVVEATLPPAEIARMLEIEEAQPCLVLRRKTLSQGQVASVATLWHPANRYQLTGSY